MTNTGLIVSSSVRPTFQVKAFVPKHTINPPVIIFEENSLIRKNKQTKNSCLLEHVTSRG